MSDAFGCDPFGRPLRTRPITSKAALALAPDLTLVTHERLGGSRGLWLRMRRLLDPHLWRSWYALPVQVRRPAGPGRADVEEYYAVVRRLRDVAEHLYQQRVEVTVAEAFLWACVHPDQTAATLASTIAAHTRTGVPHGWLVTAAGIGAAEASRWQGEGPSIASLAMLAGLRGHVLPHPDSVPTLTGSMPGAQMAPVSQAA